ncbi:MAG: DinB family protein [Propionibacteriaceae bacterium]
MGTLAAQLLLTSWNASGERLEQRCAGLTDEEYLWRPVADAWTLKPDPDRAGQWTYDYEFAPPPPAPVTSISWRIVHLIGDNEIYWEYAFGEGNRTFPDLEVPPQAQRALELWRASREPITTWLGEATDDDLAELRPSHLGEDLPAGEVVRILLDEQTHHGAEIALLRDLYLRQ